MLDVCLLLQLVFVHLVLLAMGFLVLGVPDTVLNKIHPFFESLGVLSRWRLGDFLLVHDVVVIACRLLLKLAIHVLPSVPVSLASTRDGLSSVNGHDLTSHFDATV